MTRRAMLATASCAIPHFAAHPTVAIEPRPLEFAHLPKTIASQVGLTLDTWAAWRSAHRTRLEQRITEGSAEHITYYVLQSRQFTTAAPESPARLASDLNSALPQPRAMDFLNSLDRTLDARHALITKLHRQLPTDWALERCFRHTMAFLRAKEIDRAPLDHLYFNRGLSSDTSPASTQVLARGPSQPRRILLAGPGLDLTRRDGFSDALPLRSHQFDALRMRFPQAQIDLADIRPEVLDHHRAQRCDVITEWMPGPYDLIVATNLLLYFEDRELLTAMAGFAQSLAPNGMLLHNDQRFAVKVFGDALNLPVRQFAPAQLASKGTVEQWDRAVVHGKGASRPVKLAACFAFAAVAAAAASYQTLGFLEFPPEVKPGPMSGVDIDGKGNVYVLHRGDQPLAKFNSKGKHVKSWGAGIFKVPHGIRIGPDGNVWTTDNGSHVLRVFTPDGELVRVIGEPNVPGSDDKHLRAPDDIVFASNRHFYVADAGNGRIVHFDADGKYLAQWGKKGKGAGEFSTAHSMTIDKQDRIYVGDRGNKRIQVFDQQGKFLHEWTGFGNPFGLVIAGPNMLSSEGDTHEVFLLETATGKIVEKWGGSDDFQLPHLMSIDKNGKIYLAEVNGKRIRILARETAMKALTVTLLTGFAIFAQTPELETAHASIINPPVPKSKQAADLTATFSPARAGNTRPIARRNFIDQHIFGRIDRDRIPRAGLASDEEFARRAWLDATGRIPPTAEFEAFLASSDPHKRDKLIDKLISSDAFVDKWVYYFEDLFRAGGRMGSGLNLFHFWLREWLKLDRPYNEVVTDLLTGAGKTSFSVPGGLYYARDFVKAKDDPEAPDAHDLVNQPDTVDEFTITYSKVFLGLNLACISCHDGKNHLEKVNQFLTSKKRDEFFGQAAFYGKTRQIMNWENGYQANTEYTVDDTGPEYNPKADSIVRVPRRGGDASPRFILSGERPKPGENYRDALARIMTNHPQFRRAFVNRIWAELMGFGIVEPIDDFDLLRPDQASNPALLNALAEDFGRNKFSFRHVVRTIMRSSAYQLSSRFDGEWKDAYTPYYARKFVRMLTAAELHDAIALATGIPGKFSNSGEQVGMVMQMPEPKKADANVQSFMRTFGQSNRDDMPKKIPPSALQAMMLMQSRVVTDRVNSSLGGSIRTLLETTPDDRTLVERIFLNTISRKPLAAELDVAAKAIQSDRRKGAENLQWALLNSPEFLFNY